LKFVGKILPIEGYYVQLKGIPPINYAFSLTHLYQPLIGIEAIILYQTLLHEIEIQAPNSSQTHHTLMNYLNLSVDNIYEARLKLERIGLLKTFEDKKSNEKSYTYELQCPFSPYDFFNDAMLSELLYHHIGKMKFKSLKNYFLKQENHTIGNNITASFSEVFDTFQPPSIEQDKSIQRKSNELMTKIKNIDFSWLEIMLEQRMIPVNLILTIQNKKLISDMMFLYDLPTNEVEKAVLWALTDDNTLNHEEFKKACHDLFKTKPSQQPIKLVVNKQDSKGQNKSVKPTTKEEQLIQRLETISPKQLLEDLSSGSQASEQDMKIVRDVMTSQGLSVPVMNVLIHYVLLQSNMKLSKAYLEKIASHWSRAHVKTAKEAMEFAKKEIDKFHMKTSKRKTTYRNTRPKEVVPDWFKDRNKNQPQKSQTNNPQTEKEREELAALIRQFAEE